MPGPTVAERPARPEVRAEREAFSSSPRLKMHIAQGVFEGTLNPTVPNKVANASYQAVEAQHKKLRAEDNTNQRSRLDKELDHDERLKHNFRVHLQTLKRNKGQNPTVTDEEVYHHYHMLQWAGTEASKIRTILDKVKDTPTQLEEVGRIFQNILGITVDTGVNATRLSLFNQLTNDPGSFYKNFCTGDTNAKLANALTVEQMHAIKPFIKDLLGDSTDTAFNALVALRETQDALKDDAQKQAMGSAINNPLSQADNAVFTFYKDGLALVPEEERTQPIAPSEPPHPPSPARPATPAEAQPVPGSPETKEVTHAKEEIFGKTERHERSADDVSHLIADVSGLMQREKDAGKGKMKPTIAEMNATADTHLPTHEGNVIFLPKDAGQVVVLGDIHGDLTTVKQVLEKEQVLEKLTSGQAVQVVFMGDLVDRGPRDAEVMEAVLALKKLFPDNVTIMKADHETAGGITDHNFPQHLEARYPHNGSNLNLEYIQLFGELPRMVAAANGTVFVHGGPPMRPKNLQEYAHLTDQEAKDVFDRQITWADPVPDAIAQELEKQKRLTIDDLQKVLALNKSNPDNHSIQYAERHYHLGKLQQFPRILTLGQLRTALAILSQTEGIYPNASRSHTSSTIEALLNNHYYYSKKAAEEFLNIIGGSVIVRAHEVSDSVQGGRPDPFGDILWTIHTTGQGSKESAYGTDELNPRYAIFNLAQPITQITLAENIRDVWKNTPKSSGMPSTPLPSNVQT